MKFESEKNVFVCQNCDLERVFYSAICLDDDGEPMIEVIVGRTMFEKYRDNDDVYLDRILNDLYERTWDEAYEDGVF